MCSPDPPPPRRNFLKQSLALFAGGVVTLVPAASGLFFFLGPLRRKETSNDAVHVTSLNALPNDGVPRKFNVTADRTDAWNKFKEARIGAIYLRRTGERDVHAFNVTCPHAGCFVDYQPERESYLCPCHNSLFTIEGEIASPDSPSPRGLDSLAVEIRNESEVWVEFQNFLPGQTAKIIRS